MTRSTVLLGALPRMLRAIVEHAVADQDDWQLAADDTEDDIDLDAAVTRCHADVLIVEERADRGEAFYLQLLLQHPSLTVCMLTQGGRNATVVALRRVRLMDTSATRLIEAVRDVVRGRGQGPGQRG